MVNRSTAATWPPVDATMVTGPGWVRVRGSRTDHDVGAAAGRQQ
jgi:hypothetical protein